MFLVLFFCFFIIVGLIFSKVKIVINKIELDNTIHEKGYLRNLDGRIKIYLFGFFKILSIKINKEKLKNARYTNLFSKEKLKVIEEKILSNASIKDIRQIKSIKIDLEKLDMNLNLGTEDVIITSFLIFIISNIVTFIVVNNINKNEKKQYHYIINPCYQNKNIFILDVNCIVSVKIIYIISTFMKLLYNKKSEKLIEYCKS